MQILDLSNNAFSGGFPPSLCNVTSLVELNLERNRLGNKLPDTIGVLHNLSVLDLRRNRFSGHIPKSIGKISGLTELDLSQNGFDGDVPVSLVDLTHLNSFNVSYNNLSGSVPIPLSRKFNSSSFIGNLELCGYSMSTPCPSPPPFESPPGRSHKRKFSTKDILLIAAGVLLVVLGLLCCIILCCCLMRRRRAASEEGKKNDGQTSTTSAATTSRGEKGKMPAAEGGQVEAGGEVGGKLVHFDGAFMFTADDLLCATAEIMGKSTYGTVYKATMEDGNQVAIKRLREKIAKSQKEFEKEVNLLGKIRHPNLLSLRAYCIGPEGEKLVVFDYIASGSLAAFLHARGPDTPINWPTRMNLVIGIARGLCYLHKNEDIVHGNLTSGNILLDELTNAKIADYGLFRLMTSTANSNVAATAASLGYRAPELTKLKKPNMKTDVYNFGVIMLELLTGKSPSEPTNGMDLPQWVVFTTNLGGKWVGWKDYRTPPTKLKRTYRE